jgi:hypothetical protein
MSQREISCVEVIRQQPTLEIQFKSFFTRHLTAYHFCVAIIGFLRVLFFIVSIAAIRIRGIRPPVDT